MIRILLDIGATKTQWCCYHNHARWDFVTSGINFAVAQKSTIHDVICEGMRILHDQSPEFQRGGVFADEVHAFGAGLVSESSIQLFTNQLKSVLPMAKVVDCQSDLVGAAMAVCGRESGIAAILGTGANTCQWDGKQIVQRINSGGFILGDEGSGAVLGRLFVTDYLKGLVPLDLAEKFRAQYPGTYPEIVAKVYRSDAPARFLGSIAPFLIKEYPYYPYVQELVENNFRAFLERTVTRYDKFLPVGVVGGFGYACRTILQRLGGSYGIRFSQFLPTPIDGLVQYYGV